MHPQTRWCVTLTGPDGTALAHGCARGPRPRLLDNLQTRPPPAQLAELLGRLNLTLTPISRGNCDHAAAEDRYTPSRALRHLVRARNATCDAPGCQNPAAEHRPRPHRAVARRAHRPVQPRSALQDAPSREAGTRLDRQAIRTWRHPLDAAVRPHARHHPHQI